MSLKVLTETEAMFLMDVLSNSFEVARNEDDLALMVDLGTALDIVKHLAPMSVEDFLEKGVE